MAISEERVRETLKSFGFDDFMVGQITARLKLRGLIIQEDLVKVVLVPVEIFGAESGYGLADAVSPWSDCNRAEGHIYRRDDTESEPFRNRSDVISVYVPKDEIEKFDRKVVS